MSFSNVGYKGVQELGKGVLVSKVLSVRDEDLNLDPQHAE